MAAKVALSLAHTSDPDAGALRLKSRQLLLRDALALILNFERHTVAVTGHTNHCTLASAVAMNVGQALLHQTKHHQLHFAGETFEVFRNFERNLQAAALAKALDIPAQGLGKAGFVQE